MASADRFSVSSNSASGPSHHSQQGDNWLEALGAPLAFTHDREGYYRAFYWERASECELDPQTLIGTRIDEQFQPVAIVPYGDRVRRVLSSGVPERFSYPFRYRDCYFLFDLTIAAIPDSDSEDQQVLVMGRTIPGVLSQCELPTNENPNNSHLLASGLNLHQKLLAEIVGSLRRTLPPGSELYQKLLAQMSRQIRRTLDLNTIARQTVKGLAEALGVSRCFICLYNSARNCVQVTAEYCPGDRPSLLGWDFLLEDYPDWQRALDSSDAIAVETLILPGCAPQAALIFATRYQDRPNALVCLCQEAIAGGDLQPDPDPEPDRTWGAAEIEFVRELGEQVGTAIAHATLYQELEQAREQAEAASKLKSQFLANTSHELRTPLNGMIGFLKLIMEGMAEDEEEEKQFIEEAYRSALHLLNLINDILDIAKIEAGKMHLDLNPVNLGELVSTVENHTRALVQQKNLTLQIQLPETEDEILLYGNYQRLLQVMLNIVGNAIKFTHEGGIEIRATIVKNKVEVRGLELPGVVQISVTDTGIGVSLDKQDKLFQSFSQVDSDRTRQYGGTGLGLAISQKLIEAMGGLVNFYSLGEGLGSTVTFVVPLYQEPAIVSLGSPDSLDLLS